MSSAKKILIADDEPDILEILQFNLQAEGYDVVGVTLQLYDHGAAVNKPGACCAGQDIRDARNVDLPGSYEILR